jgi:hypothetical protein
MNLSVITQALTGGVVISDPARDREFKRTRKQISDGIQGSAIGLALLIAATLAYSLIARTPWIYTTSLVLALGGIIKLFRGAGSIADAKLGPKLIDPALQPRGTGHLGSSQNLVNGVRASKRLNESGTTNQPTHPKPISLDTEMSSQEAPLDGLPRPGTGRINREHSSPLRAFDKDSDLMSKLRN